MFVGVEDKLVELPFQTDGLCAELPASRLERVDISILARTGTEVCFVDLIAVEVYSVGFVKCVGVDFIA